MVTYSEKDIGSRVRHFNNPKSEIGVITKANDSWVWVRFGGPDQTPMMFHHGSIVRVK